MLVSLADAQGRSQPQASARYLSWGPRKGLRQDSHSPVTRTMVALPQGKGNTHLRVFRTQLSGRLEDYPRVVLQQRAVSSTGVAMHNGRKHAESNTKADGNRARCRWCPPLGRLRRKPKNTESLLNIADKARCRWSPPHANRRRTRRGEKTESKRHCARPGAGDSHSPPQEVGKDGIHAAWHRGLQT